MKELYFKKLADLGFELFVAKKSNNEEEIKKIERKIKRLEKQIKEELKEKAKEWD